MINLLLLLIAVILYFSLLPFAIIYALGASFVDGYKKEGIKCAFKTMYARFSNLFLRMAISIDQLGNVTCNELFNDALIKHSSNKFGNEDETISSVLGKNKVNNSLSIGGKMLDFILNLLDRNHSIKSIEN